MTTYYASGALWNTAGNWGTTSGASDGAVPGSSDDVIFDSSSANMAIDTTAACASLTSTGFTNTLTQNASQTLTVSGDIAWAAGTFTGGDSAITTETFTLTGGAWTSTSGALLCDCTSLTASTTYFYFTGGAYTAPIGSTVTVDTHNYNDVFTFENTVALDLYNLTVLGGSSHEYGRYRFTTTGTLTVENDLTVERDYSSYIQVYGGIINLEGDLSVTGFADVPYSYSASYIPTNIHITGGAVQSYSCTNSTSGGLGVTLPTGTTSTFQPAAGEEALTHTFSSLALVAGTFVAPTGILALQTAAMLYPYTPSLTLLASSGGAFTHSSGTVRLDSRTYNKDITVSITSLLTLYNLNIRGGSSHAYGEFKLGTSAALIVTNDLIIERTFSSNLELVGGGSITAHGDVTVSGITDTNVGIILAGTGDQTITHTDGLLPGGTWTVTNTDGHVIQATAVTLGGALTTDTDSRWCQGVYDLAAGTTTNNGTIVKDNAGVSSPTIASGNAVEIGSCVPAAGGAWSIAGRTFSFPNKKRRF